MINDKKYLDRFREAYSKLRPRIEEIFGIPLEGIKFKPMTRITRDLSRKTIEKEKEIAEENPYLGINPYDEKYEKILQKTLEFVFIPAKFVSNAFVTQVLPETIYISVYPHKKLRLKKSIEYAAAHELCHSSIFSLYPYLLDQTKGEVKKLEIKKRILEGVVDYLVPEVLNGIGYSPTVRMMRLRQNFEEEHRFVKKVCEKKGKDFALRILENFPKNRREMQNPELYLERIND